jgi:hypothetical protein
MVEGLVQVNLEYLARVVFNSNGVLYPDSLVGTDSHTTMIDGLGVAGWGVGGIEAEAAMLGQVCSQHFTRGKFEFLYCVHALCCFSLNKKSLHLEGIIGFPGVTNTPIGIECTTFCGAVKAIEKSSSAYGSLRCARLRGPNFFAAAHEYGPPRGCRF